MHKNRPPAWTGELNVFEIENLIIRHTCLLGLFGKEKRLNQEWGC